MKRVRLIASGNVQGVFFRASAADRAAQLGITGWARNTPDAQVELEAQGEPGAVETFVAYCRAGPGKARVAQLTVSQADVVAGEAGFAVRG